MSFFSFFFSLPEELMHSLSANKFINLMFQLKAKGTATQPQPKTHLKIQAFIIIIFKRIKHHHCMP